MPIPMAERLRQVPASWWIAAAVVVGIGARIAAVSVAFDWADPPLFGDGVYYTEIARAVVETGSLPTHHHPVGYPLFLAGLFSVFGMSFTVVRMLQVLAGAVTIVAIAGIADRLWNRSSAILAAWGAALYPPLLYMTGRIMSETLFTCLLTVSLFLWIEWDRRRHRRLAAGAALALGLASLVRANLLPIVGLVPIWQILRNRADRRPRFEAVFAPLAITVAILVAPGAYFLAAHGEVAPLATNSGKTFIGANNALATGRWVSIDEHPELVEALPPADSMSEAAYSRALMGLGFRWIRENPADFVALLPKKFAHAWLPGVQGSGVTDRTPGAFLLLTASYGLLLALGLAGLLVVRPTEADDGLLISVLVVYTVMSLVFYGNSRIALPCAPILLAYAGAFVAERLLPRVRRLRRAPGPVSGPT